MAKIIGNTTATPNPRPDWNQTDETKADYIKNKPTVLTEDEIVVLIQENGGDAGIQSDWNQTDATKADYIKNKPDINSQDVSDNVLCSTGNIAGVKGFYWKELDTSLSDWCRFALYRDQACTDRVTSDQLLNEYGWQAGDVVSLVNDAKYDEIGIISSIGDDYVMFPASTIPFSSRIEMSNPNFDDYAFFNVTRPHAGAVDFGMKAIAVGQGNKSLNWLAASFGRDNIAIGQYAFATGRQNQVGSLTAGFGRQNVLNGMQSFGMGLKNTIHWGGIQDAIFGRENNIKTGIRSAVFGYKNTLDVTSSGTSDFITGSENNISAGSNTFVCGKLHTITGGDKPDSNPPSNCIIGGEANIINGGMASLIVGKNNTILNGSGGYNWPGAQSIMGGLNNTIGNNAVNALVVGRNNIVNGQNQTVVGKYNKEDAFALFMVGNGVAGIPSNILTVSESDVKIGGDLSVAAGHEFDGRIHRQYIRTHKSGRLSIVSEGDVGSIYIATGGQMYISASQYIFGSTAITEQQLKDLLSILKNNPGLVSGVNIASDGDNVTIS